MADKKQPSLAAESLTRFVKGGAAGLFAGAILQPLQVIKTTMQVSPVEVEKDATTTTEASKKVQEPAKMVDKA
jgi:hypothetical protein